MRAERRSDLRRPPFAAALGLLLLVSALWPEALQAESGPVPVIDLHVDLPYQHGYKGQSFSTGKGEFRAERLLKAGVAGVVLPLFVPKDAKPAGRTQAQLEKSYARVFGQLLMVRPYSLPGCGVHRAAGESRRLETWLGFEGSGPLEPSTEEMRSWAVRGVRSFGIVHSQHNRLATSSGQAVGRRGGLSKLGRQYADAVLDVGGVLDVSHSSDETTADVLKLAEQRGGVVMATHSNARALANHPRNLRDEDIRGIAASGGVIGVNFHQRFLEPVSGHATLEHVVEQVKYLVRVGGADVVAIGSDFEGGIRAVPELSSAAQFQNLARALRQEGFREGQVRAFMSGNARRVLCSAGD